MERKFDFFFIFACEVLDNSNFRKLNFPGIFDFSSAFFFFFSRAILNSQIIFFISFTVVIYIFYLRKNIALVHIAHVIHECKAIIFVMFHELASVFIFIFIQFWSYMNSFMGFEFIFTACS